MSTVFRKLATLALTTAALTGGCAPAEDWTNPEFIQIRLEVGDDRAFDEMTRLTDEQQRTLVPTLINVYNSGIKQEAALTALLAVADPSARDVFRAALTRSDDHLAGLAARGLAAIGDTESGVGIAQRFSQVTTREEFAPFMEALRQVPSPQAGDVIAGVMLRPAQRIGGIETVRSGCTFLGMIDDPSDEIIQAMVFGLINFIPQPFEDAINECELGLMRSPDRAVPKLVELLEERNQRVTDHLRNLQYPPVTGQVRAALVLAHIHNDPAIAAFTTWFSTPHPLPRAELSEMPIQAQMEWYTTHGQLFDVATMALAYNGSEGARQTLLSLESLGEGRLLNNFEEWFGLSEGAEIGLRQSVQEALFMIGNPEDRALLWTIAETGNVARGGENSDTLFRLNALHYVGRGAQPGEIARFDTVVAAQPERFRKEFLPLRAYFLAADHCAADLSCWQAVLLDTSPILNDPSLQTAITAIPEGPERDGTIVGVNSCTRAGAVWHLTQQFGNQIAGCEALVSNMGFGPEGVPAEIRMETRMNIAEAMLLCPQMPNDTPARIDSLLEAESGLRGIPLLREYRHSLRLAKLSRFPDAN